MSLYLNHNTYIGFQKFSIEEKNKLLEQLSCKSEELQKQVMVVEKLQLELQDTQKNYEVYKYFFLLKNHIGMIYFLLKIIACRLVYQFDYASFICD